MTKLRNNPSNILSRVDAGTNPNQPGIDITKTDIFGNEVTYQNKAYTSKSSPNVSNTPKDAIVVTSKEKVDAVRNKGYQVEEFKTGNEIKSDTSRRMKEFESGKAGRYTVGGVAGVMFKAGTIGCTVGAGIETLTQYKRYKNGEISGKEYLNSIARAGGHGGVTAAATAGLMIPVKATITAAGLANPITIPVAFVIGIGVDRIVAPIFKRGQYAVQLANAKFYNDLNVFYGDLANEIKNSGEAYHHFIVSMVQQHLTFQQHKQDDELLTAELNNILESI
jgi:hypothetical protein